MKHLKMATFAAVATVALTVFMGAGVASATELYSGATTLKSGTKADFSAVGSIVLEDTSTNRLQTCTGGTYLISFENTGSAGVAVKGSVSKEGLTWTGCSVPTSTTEGGQIEISWTSGTNGTVTAKGFKISVNTILFGNCVFTAGTGTDMGTLAGSTTGTATLAINAVLTKVSGICGATIIYSGTFVATSPDPLHVTNS